MDHYVYLDETGTPDFVSTAADPYFGVGSAHWRGEHSAALWEGHRLRLELESRGIRLPKGLHAKDDSGSTRAAVFAEIASQAPRIDATLLLKGAASASVQSEGKLRLYKLAVWLHLKFVVPTVSAPGDTVFVIVGHLQTTGKREAIRHAVVDIADQLGNDRVVVPCIWESRTTWGLQVADYGLWRVQREHTGKDVPRYSRCIDEHIATVFEPWGAFGQG